MCDEYPSSQCHSQFHGSKRNSKLVGGWSTRKLSADSCPANGAFWDMTGVQLFEPRAKAV